MTLPVAPLTRPAVLDSQSNGRLDPTILTVVDGQADGPDVRLVKPAARAWVAMCAAALAAGHVLKASGPSDSYRPYEVQEKIFRQRYTTTVLAGRPYRRWLGQRWYQRPGTAAAAVPGTSNHGWGLAVDIGEELDGDGGTESITADAVKWLCAHAYEFGFSAELQSEPWHWRYVAGDRVPDAVLAHGAPIQPPALEEDTVQMIFVRRKDSPQVYIGAVGLTPRPVKFFADAEFHTTTSGGTVKQLAAGTASTEEITDGQGQKRRVLVVADGSLYGI